MTTIINPNTGLKTPSPSSSTSDVDQKINILSKTWATTSNKQRIFYLKKIQTAYKHHAKKLSHLISTETGKPLWESNSEVTVAIKKIDATITAFNYRCNYPIVESGKKTITTIIKPIGVVAILGPYNFPLHIPNGQIIPALLTGNTVIVKLSEYCPNTAKLIANIWANCFKSIESPIQFVYGGKSIGEYLVKHHKVDLIYFTGSSKTGLLIEKQCHQLRKPCALEMGGNNALIIDDISNQHIVNHILYSAFITAGQRCSCARRIIINKKHSNLIDKIVKKTQQLSINCYPASSPPFMGPVVQIPIKKQLLQTKFKNSTTLLKSKDIGPGGLVSPRIEQSNQPHHDELFGPIIFISLIDSFDDAIQLVNQSDYGLTCSIYTKSKSKFNHGVTHINCGVINWNTPSTGASSLAPFGGSKLSGNYKPGGFNMIDHCIVPVASSQSKQIGEILLPGQ